MGQSERGRAETSRVGGEGVGWIFKEPQAQQGEVPIILRGGLTQTNFVR